MVGQVSAAPSLLSSHSTLMLPGQLQRASLAIVKRLSCWSGDMDLGHLSPTPTSVSLFMWGGMVGALPSSG